MDNTPAQYVRLTLSYTDETGNTYQDRELDDGTTYSVMKNFPTEKVLFEASSSFGINPRDQIHFVAMVL